MKVLWLLVGLTSVGVGAVGVVLPLLPTTPFLLIAAFAFARSSVRLDNWLREHQSFGPLINNWHRDGSIDRKERRIAILVILITPVITWLFGAPLMDNRFSGFCLGRCGRFYPDSPLAISRPSPVNGTKVKRTRISMSQKTRSKRVND